MIYCFDLDGTLCVTDGRDYDNAVPIPERIAQVNALYAQGHEIWIDSARGSQSDVDWDAVTLAQVRDWGLQCHGVRTGVKVAADVYVDDKAIPATSFFVQGSV